MNANMSRIRPTALNRRRRGGRASSIEDEIQAEADIELDILHEEVTDDEVPVGPFPRGPEDPSILTSFRTHIAVAIWEQQVYIMKR